MAAVAGKDQLALRRLYDRHAGLLLHVAFSVAGSWEAAEEVVQDVFVQCWARAGAYQPSRGTAAGWLVAMARNRAIDHLRRTNAARRGNGHSISLEAVPQELVDDDPLPGARLDLGDVASALNELPRTERTAILLAVHGGLTHMEIADLMQAPPGTVKSWIRRGMARLRARIEHDGYRP
jgi:RNA polymerase sigma-70 factor (ECF subfamily)